MHRILLHSLNFDIQGQAWSGVITAHKNHNKKEIHCIIQLGSISETGNTIQDVPFYTWEHYLCKWPAGTSSVLRLCPCFLTDTSYILRVEGPSEWLCWDTGCWPGRAPLRHHARWMRPTRVCCYDVTEHGMRFERFVCLFVFVYATISYLRNDRPQHAFPNVFNLHSFIRRVSYNIWSTYSRGFLPVFFM